MVTWWRSWAKKLTEDERREIEKASYGFAWLNWDKRTKSYEGGFCYFPYHSGYKDSPRLSNELMRKVELKELENGWLIYEEPKGTVGLETVAEMFPEEIDKLYEKFQAKISEEPVK